MGPRAAIVGAAAALVAAFVCPLVLGGVWIIGPRLLTDAPPGLRIMALVPGVIGPVVFVGALKLPSLWRAALAMLGGGVGIILLIGALEALTVGQAGGLTQIFTRGALAMPAPHGLLLFSLAVAACFGGLALSRTRPTVGGRIAGFAGAALLALHLAPLDGRTALAVMLDPVVWKTSWPIPCTLIATAAFALISAAQLFPDYLPQGRRRAWFARLSLLVGCAALALFPVGLLVDTAARAPELLATTATFLIKTLGTWIALHALLVAGALSLVPPPATSRR